MQLQVLDPKDPDQAFPALGQALSEPNGLLSIGGCLTARRLINAYSHGVFPWYNPGEPILWWSPDPRLVLFPDKINISRSLNKTLRKNRFEVVYDCSFREVMQACAAPRTKSQGTWINQDMLQAYTDLHELGFAHSFETWLNGELAGGLYGIAIGRVFFGESMFHRYTDASKVAFAHLVQQLTLWGYKLIDCQVSSEHLQNFGAEELPRETFRNLLDEYCPSPPNTHAWRK